jgi:Exocyst complex subunit Sec15-like
MLSNGHVPYDAYWVQIRDFVQRFYQFVEGVSQHHRNVDELLSKVCDHLFLSIANELVYSHSTPFFPTTSAIVTGVT